MTITVRLFAAARAAAGTGAIEAPAAPLAEVLSSVVARTDPSLAAVLEHCAFVVGGVRRDPADPTPLERGTVVDVLPPFAGG